MNYLLFLLIFCFFLLDVLIVIVLRKIKKHKKVKVFSSQWRVWANKKQFIPSWQHVLLICFGLIFSTISYVMIIRFFKPHFSMPKTESINWYTVHNYPRQQDMFYFVTAFSFIVIITCLLWFLWIWQKNKK